MGVDPDGTHVSDLAERAAMAKRAVGELIRHLAAHDYLTVEPDPDDGRAKRVADLRETLDRIITSPDHAGRDHHLRRGDGEG
jgi:DNA-binding MarR family transcriptional regulator